MKVRQALAVLAVLVIGLLAGKLVSGMFSARSLPAAQAQAQAQVQAPASAVPRQLVVIGTDCVVPVTAEVPGGPTAVRPDETTLVAANAHAATVFGVRRELGIDVIRAHVACARMIEANIDSFRLAGPVDAFYVRATLGAFRLKDVQVLEDPAGQLVFGAWSGLACVVGVLNADDSWVAVIAPLPDGKCLA